MRKFDLDLANEVLEPTFVFMRSQTDRIRLSIKELGEYLRYREQDVGKAYVPGPTSRQDKRLNENLAKTDSSQRLCAT